MSAINSSAYLASSSGWCGHWCLWPKAGVVIYTGCYGTVERHCRHRWIKLRGWYNLYTQSFISCTHCRTIG